MTSRVVRCARSSWVCCTIEGIMGLESLPTRVISGLSSGRVNKLLSLLYFSWMFVMMWIFPLRLLKYVVLVWNWGLRDHVLELYILVPGSTNLFQITLNLSYFMIWIIDYRFISWKDNSNCSNMHLNWSSLQHWIDFSSMLIDIKWKQHTEICNNTYLPFTSKCTQMWYDCFISGSEGSSAFY